MERKYVRSSNLRSVGYDGVKRRDILRVDRRVFLRSAIRREKMSEIEVFCKFITWCCIFVENGASFSFFDTTRKRRKECPRLIKKDLVLKR